MDTATLWKRLLGELEVEIARPTFKTFFAATKLVTIDGGVATISCPNPVSATTIETRYYALVKQHLDRIIEGSTSLVFTIDQASVKKVPKNPAPTLPLFTTDSDQEIITTLMRRAHLNPVYTFDNFAVSGSNQMAYAAATAVAKNPGTAYNPLFLWGGVGVGKSHIMHAIGHALLHKKSRSRIVYCMGEEFTNEIVDAIQTKTTKQFKQKYRTADVFLIDDIQFIAGKNTVQEEFFHTFNTIHREGGQIVLTSDRPPAEIAKLEDRLRSRFEGGLTIDISPPDFELRSAILRIKAQQKGVMLPMDVAQFIAANISDTRKLEGTLVRLLSEVELKKLPITTELAQTILGKQEDKKNGWVKPKLTNLKEMVRVVAHHFDLSEAQLKGEKRDKYIAVPRQIIMYLLRTEFGINYADIGNLLGGRDHTTIMYGVDKIAKEMSENHKLRGDIEGIKREFSG